MRVSRKFRKLKVRLAFGWQKVLTGLLTPVIMAGVPAAVVAMEASPASASGNCMWSVQNTWDCPIPPLYQGVSHTDYGVAAYECARDASGGILWIKNYNGFPSPRTCMDFKLLWVSNDPHGKINYALDFYKHYGVLEYQFTKWVTYVSNLAHYLEAVGHAGYFMVTPAFCGIIGAALGPLADVACGYLGAFIDIRNG